MGAACGRLLCRWREGAPGGGGLSPLIFEANVMITSYFPWTIWPKFRSNWAQLDLLLGGGEGDAVAQFSSISALFFLEIEVL